MVGKRFQLLHPRGWSIPWNIRCPSGLDDMDVGMEEGDGGRHLTRPAYSIRWVCAFAVYEDRANGGWSAASAAGGTDPRALVLCPSHTLGSCTTSPTPDLTKSKHHKISTRHNALPLLENATNHTLKINLTYRHTCCRSSCNGTATGRIRLSRILTHRLQSHVIILSRDIQVPKNCRITRFADYPCMTVSC